MDRIPTKVLKSTPDNVVCILTQIFNLSLRSGRLYFLNKFKLAKVISFFKKEARHYVTLIQARKSDTYFQKRSKALR